MEQNNLQESSNWVSTPIAPWRRYFARLFDITFFGLAGFFALGFISYSLVPVAADAFFSGLNPIVDMILTALMGFILSGFVMGLVGSTIGKAIFGIRVRNLNGQTIGPINGLMRDLDAYVRGAALGIPLVSLIPVYMAWSKLKKQGTTFWDQGRYIVTYRKSSGYQTTLTIIGIILYILMIMLVRALDTI
jgi:uncharacterized RDD family membrane protein YckC